MQNMGSRANKSRRNTKKLAVDMLGGECSVCGYKKCVAALDFHHKNPEEKDFQISHYRKREDFLKEIEKCELLCKNCHAEKHAAERKTKIGERARVVLRFCKTHGETPFYCFNVKGKKDKYACAICMIERQKRAREKLKTELVQSMGGSCQSCGYNHSMVALEFHHTSGKERQVSTIKNREEAFLEIKKCKLLCRNCHMEEHWTVA